MKNTASTGTTRSFETLAEHPQPASTEIPASWSGRAEVERETAEWVRWFNADRLHSSIDYLSPIWYETRSHEHKSGTS